MLSICFSVLPQVVNRGEIIGEMTSYQSSGPKRVYILFIIALLFTRYTFHSLTTTSSLITESVLTVFNLPTNPWSHARPISISQFLPKPLRNHRRQRTPTHLLPAPQNPSPPQILRTPPLQPPQNPSFLHHGRRLFNPLSPPSLSRASRHRTVIPTFQ